MVMPIKYHTTEERKAAARRTVARHEALMREEGLTLEQGLERQRIALGLPVGTSRRKIAHAAADRLEGER